MRQPVRVFRQVGVAFCVVLSLLSLAGCSGGQTTDSGATGSHFIRSLETESKGGRKASKVIVFVHGVLGDARTTWESKGGPSWSNIVNDDQRFREFDIYTIGYHSPALQRSSDIDEIAGRVLQVDLIDKLLARYDEVHFIAHSMGGLIIKRALAKLRARPSPTNEYLQKVATVIFISTPAAGSQLADWASWFAVNPQLKNMQTEEGATFLNSIEGDWGQLLQARRPTQLLPRAFCGYETRPTKSFLVVPRLYSQAACDGERIAFDFDHMMIVKPSNANHPVYQWSMARIEESTKRFVRLREVTQLENEIYRNMRPRYYQLTFKPIEEWIHLDPENPVPHYRKAVVHFKLKEFPAALVAADKALSYRADYDAAKFVKASTFMRQGNFPDAKVLFEQRVRKDPDYQAARLNLAETLLALKSYTESAIHYRAVLASAKETKERRAPLLGLGIIDLSGEPSSAGTRKEGIAKFRETLCVDSSIQGLFFGRHLEDGDEWFDVYTQHLNEIRTRGLNEYQSFLRELRSGRSMC